MKQIRKPLGRDKKGKQLTVMLLFTGATAIMASGVWFAIHSIINQTSIKVINTTIPGFVLALLVVYFGLRSFLSVFKLSKEILKDSSYFSWSNFKKAKPVRSR